MQLQPEIVIAAGGGSNGLVSYGGLATSAELNNPGGAVTLNGSGVGTCATAALTAGVHSIQAVYSPSSSNFLASTSPVFSQTVNKAAPAVTWATPAPITYGTALSATLAWLLLFRVPAQRRFWRGMFALSLLLDLPVCGGTLGCGGSVTLQAGNAIGNSGTTPGAYVVNVAGTSGNTTVTTAVNLTVE
jgi:hypothetical protein